MQLRLVVGKIIGIAGMSLLGSCIGEASLVLFSFDFAKNVGIFWRCSSSKGFERTWFGGDFSFWVKQCVGGRKEWHIWSDCLNSQFFPTLDGWTYRLLVKTQRLKKLQMGWNSSRIQSFVMALTERGTTLAKGGVLRNNQQDSGDFLGSVTLDKLWRLATL